MFKAKYQAHRLVNIIFYIIVFFIGFYIGVMGQKVGIKSLFDKFLIIDTVYADELNVNITSDFNSDFYPSSNNWYDESLIINIFNQVNLIGQLDLNISSYLNIYSINLSPSYPNDYIYIFSTSSFTGSSSQVYTTGSYIRVDIKPSGNSTQVIYSYLSNVNHSNLQVLNSGISYQLAATNSPSHTINHSLDFSIYHSFNENLFANNNYFKQVCINPIKPFTISTTDNEYSNPSDFLWFPYQIIQLNSGLYHTLNRNFVWNDETKHVFFNSYDLIDDYFITGVGLQMQPWISFSNLTYLYPYDNRYNYYGWNVYPFSITDLNTENPVLPIFKFSDDFITLQLSSFGIAHGGMTRTHYDLTDENNQNLSMCFYINKMYDVYSLDIDENGNFYGNVDTSNGSIDIYSDNQYNYFTMIDDNLFGFTSILTAPLTAIRQISNGTCSPVSIPILGKTITLPCGDTIFWGREDVQDFKLFWNMFFGGVICYGLGISTFKRIQRFKDPTDDKVEVIDL